MDITKIIKTISEKGGGTFGLRYDDEKKDWSAAMEWGQEAPDSPMYGAAAYGLGETAKEAIDAMLGDAGK